MRDHADAQLAQEEPMADDHEVVAAMLAQPSFSTPQPQKSYVAQTAAADISKQYQCPDISFSLWMASSST